MISIKINFVLRIVRDGNIVVNLLFKTLTLNKYSHLGGLILALKEVISKAFCQKDIMEKENSFEKRVKKSFSISMKYHTNYFHRDTHLSKRCAFRF